MLTPYDICWNGKLYMAGDPIPDTEEKLIRVLSVFEDLFENAIGNDLIEPFTEPVTEHIAPATKKGK